MRYTDWIIPELRALRLRRDALRSGEERLKVLEARVGRIRSSLDLKQPGGSGDNAVEESMINDLAERELLERQLRRTYEDVRWVEDGLAALCAEDRRVLDLFFVRHAGILAVMDELHVEQSEAYRRKNAALIRLAMAMIGRAEV